MVHRAVDPALVVVTGVRVLGRYVLEVTFDTTEVKIIDNLFCQVRADAETGPIAWPAAPA